MVMSFTVLFNLHSLASPMTIYVFMYVHVNMNRNAKLLIQIIISSRSLDE